MTADRILANLRRPTEHAPTCGSRTVTYGLQTCPCFTTGPSWDEAEEAADEIEALRRWKQEAIEVLGQWEQVWEALGRPGVLGESKSAGVLREYETLREDLAAVRRALGEDDQ